MVWIVEYTFWRRVSEEYIAQSSDSFYEWFPKRLIQDLPGDAKRVYSHWNRQQIVVISLHGGDSDLIIDNVDCPMIVNDTIVYQLVAIEDDELLTLHQYETFEFTLHNNKGQEGCIPPGTDNSNTGGAGSSEN